MLVAERHDKIVQLINERGSVRVSELSDLFRVTEETIRRDLDALEGQGELRRSHGGAVRAAEHLEKPYTEREIERREEKRGIARAALSLIAPGDQIVIDASSTTLCLAEALPNIPLKVVTNSIRVAVELAAKDKISVILSGGSLTTRSMSLVGPTAEQSLEKYHVARAFLSCKGVHAQHGISESNELQALVKQKMIKIADEVVVLADSSKFGVQDFTTICSIREISAIVTDPAASREHVGLLEAQGVRVIKEVSP